MKNYFVVIVVLFLFLPVYGLSNNPIIGSDTLQFICNELLTKPTSNSITINACANKDLDAYYEYGTDSLNYLNQTNIQTCPDSIPFVFVLENLNPNTRYFYRMRYREVGKIDYFYRRSYTFQTQRQCGSTFTFAIEADPHLDTNSNPDVYSLTLQNIISRKPDFLLDLGDTFMSGKLPDINQTEITKRYLLLRSYFDIVCHSTPLFLVLGNHDGEVGWCLDSTANNLPVWATNTRKLYFPNPSPDPFYSGNLKHEPYIGLRENYYAWQWGNSLFVVLDPYWSNYNKFGWGSTLGFDQYNWLKNTLTASQAKFKFIFCHQLVGGNGNNGRGGTEFAHLFEMGGYNLDSTWGYNTYRQGWEKPIHSLMKENDVTIFFHGHDHFYGKQDKDGIVYQEVPQPSSKNFTTISSSEYGYVNGVFIPSRGYILVTVTDTSTKVEYIRTYLTSEENAERKNGEVSHSYTILNSNQNFNDTPPKEFTLHQNFPNPFNLTTTISFSIPVQGSVSLELFNVIGQQVDELVNENLSAGNYTFKWNAKDQASGIYFYKLRAGSLVETKKMMLLK